MSKFTIFETEHFTVTQAENYAVPGYIIIFSKQECVNMADFSPEQASDLFQCIAKAESLLHALLEPERVYILRFGEALPRIHFHVFPRTAEIAAAYTQQVDDAPPYNGAKLIDWIWQNHQSLGFSEAQVLEFVERAQAAL